MPKLPHQSTIEPVESRDSASKEYTDLSGAVSGGAIINAQSGAFVSASNQYANGGDTAAYDGLGAITIEGWIRATDFATTMAICGKEGNTGGTWTFRFRINTSKILEGVFSADGNATTTNGTVPIAAAAGEWTHVAIAWDGAGNVTFYDNGVLTSTNAFGQSGTLFNSTAPFRIAGEGGGLEFNGNISELRIWDHVRSEQQLQDGMFAAMTGREFGLVSLHHLNGNFRDYGPGGVDCTAVNGATFAAAVPWGTPAQSVLTSGGSLVDITSAAPVAGQTLIADSPTTASWQDIDISTRVAAAQGAYLQIHGNNIDNVVAGTVWTLDNIITSRGDLAVASNQVTGLKAGRTYLLQAAGRLNGATSPSTGFCDFSWYNVTAATNVGISGNMSSVSSASAYSSKPTATYVFTPDVDTVMEVRVTGATAGADLAGLVVQVIEIGAVQAEVVGGLEFMDIIEVTTPVVSAAFGAGGDGLFGRALDGDIDEEYVLSYYWPKPDGVVLHQLEVHPNGVDVGAASNWDRHISTGTTSSGAGLAIAVNGSAGTGTGMTVSGDAVIYAKTGKKRMIGAKTVGASTDTTDVIGIEIYSQWDDTSTNITGLTIIDEAANLPVGTRLILYRRTRANLRADVANSYERTVSAAVAQGTATPGTEYTTGLVVHGGSVVGVTAFLQEAVTNGTVTVNVKVEGTTVISTVLNTTNPQKNYARASIGVNPVAAGDEVTVEIATSGYLNGGGVTSGIVVQVGLINSSLILDGALARRVLPDASDALVYDMVSATAGSLPNVGSASSAGNLTGTGAPVVKTGFYDSCVDTGAISAKNLYSGGAGIAESSSLSVSMWVKPKVVGSLSRWFLKEYRNDNTWVAPFWSVSIETSSATSILFGVTVGAVNYSVTLSNFNHGLGMWHHIGLTYNSATGDLYGYWDGQQWGPANTGGGAIDYGTSGTWVVGGTRSTGAPAEHAACQFEDVRVASVVRSASWFEDAWRRGLRLT